MKIWEILAASLQRQKSKKTIIDSIMYNTLQEVFLAEKWIDIEKFIISTDFVEGRLRIKTSKPIISEEIHSISGLLEEQILKKLSMLWEKYNKIDIYTI